MQVSFSSSEEERSLAVDASEILSPGFAVGKYTVQHLHAKAGFSCVYRAVDAVTGQQVALKVLHEKLAELPRHVERFRREYEALRSIRHPNVVEIVDYGLIDGTCPYFVMEWCAGATLESVLMDGGFTLEEALPILRQLIFAVQEVHKVGVIHRDIKPGNIILLPSADGAPLLKLIDFGISTPSNSSEAQRTSLTSTGASLGTPYFMSPEQIFGLPLDERTDVYAIGVLAYELLTGQKPFAGASVAEVVDMHLHLPPPRASALAPVPEAIDLVIQTCMAKEIGDRYASVSSIFAALERAGRSEVPAATVDASLRDAIGVHVDLDFSCPEDDVEDVDFDRLEELLSHSLNAAAAAGLRVALESGNGFLAVALLPRQNQTELRQTVVRFAREVAHRYNVGSSSSISLSIVIHVGRVKAEVCAGVTSFVGGDLLALADWSVVQDVSLIVATAAAVRGLGLECENVPGRPGYVRIS